MYQQGGEARSASTTATSTTERRACARQLRKDCSSPIPDSRPGAARSTPRSRGSTAAGRSAGRRFLPCILSAMTAIVILGMHRSGTSATTRALGSQARTRPDRTLGQVLGEPGGCAGRTSGSSRPRGRWECPPSLAGRVDWIRAAALVFVPRRGMWREYGSAVSSGRTRTCMTPAVLARAARRAAGRRVHPPPSGRGRPSLAAPELLGRAHGYVCCERFNGDAPVTPWVCARWCSEYGRCLRIRRATWRASSDAQRLGVRLPTTRRPPTWSSRRSAGITRRRRSRRPGEHCVATTRALHDPAFASLGRCVRARRAAALALSPISTELLEISRSFAPQQQETRQLNTELRRLAGSCKRPLRRLIQSSLRARPPARRACRSTSPVTRAQDRSSPGTGWRAPRCSSRC